MFRVEGLGFGDSLVFTSWRLGFSVFESWGYGVWHQATLGQSYDVCKGAAYVERCVVGSLITVQRV